MKCPVCNDQRTSVEGQLFDDRYGYPGRYKLWRCHSCRHEFLECGMTAAQLGELYNDYYPRGSLDVPEQMLRPAINGFAAWFKGADASAFRWVPAGVRVLDVGCGFGESLAYHTARGCDVYGVEADANIRRVADKFGYRVHVGLFDDRLYQEGFFDYVTMDQVIEHVTDPVATLKGVCRILKPGGRAVLGTPNAGGWGAKLFGSRWLNWHVPYHQQFFTVTSMKSAAQLAGLEIESMRTVTNSDWLLYQWIHLVTAPQPGKPSWFWSPDQTSRGFVQRLLVRLVRLLHRTGFDHAVTRLFDALGRGDNFIFVLRKR